MNHRQKLAGEKSNAVSKFFVYLLMAVLTAVIVVPVAWVFMASVKQTRILRQPLALPEGLYLQNFADAWTKARMGDYFFTSIMITAVALCILLVVAAPPPMY